MAAASQVCHSKRARDEYWNGALALPDAKRVNSVSLVHDTYLMALLDKIDNMGAAPNDPGQATVVVEKGSTEFGAMKQRELTDSYSEAISVSDTLGEMRSGGNPTYYDDVLAEVGFFMDNTADEFGIMMNLFYGDSMVNMYSDAVYGYAETPAVSYGSLWEDNLWQLNEPPVIQNGFASPQEEDFGISGAEFHDVWNDFRSIQRMEEGL